MAQRSIESIYPLSPAQRGILFHAAYAEASGVYVNQLAITIEGELDQAAFLRAWKLAAARHPALRTSFHWDDLERPLQVVDRDSALEPALLDQDALPPAEQEAWEERHLAEERRTGFDLRRPPPLRVLLARRGPGRHRLLLSYHHILLDAWSVQLLFQEVFETYEALRRGEPVRPSPAPEYRGYIAWLEKQDPAASERFWRELLSGFAAPTVLPYDREPRGLFREEDRYPELVARIPAARAAAIRAQAARCQVSTASMMFAAWGLLLGRHAGEADVTFGTTVAGRAAPVSGVETALGLFINTLPLRLRPSGALTVEQYLREAQDQQVQIRDHEHSQLVDVRRATAVPAQWPLFESLVVFQNRGLVQDGSRTGSGLSFSGFRQLEQSSYPLTLVMDDAPEELTVLLAHNGRRFSSGEARALLDRFVTALDALAQRPDRKLAEVDLLPEAERQRVLREWNATAAPRPEGALVHQLFEAQVDRTPDATALERGGERLTYRQLDERANRLAHHLRALGVGPESLVALLLAPSFEAIVSMYAVLKAGGAYVPLDPDAPEDRLARVLGGARVAVALATQAVAARVPAGIRCVRLDAEAAEIARGEGSRLPATAAPENLAYVVFTSGSTGEPRGVEVTHRSVVNHNLAALRRFQLGPQDRSLQFTPIQFDAAVEEIYPQLASGAAVILQGELVPGDEFTALIQRERLTLLSLPPAYAHEWLLQLERGGGRIPGTVRLVLLGGEPIRPETFQLWKRLGGEHAPWLNVYGPTEATVTSAMCEIRGDFQEPVLPIGGPIANARIYLLDRHLQPVPPGVAGELCIAGDGLARGYRGLPELTAEKFVPDLLSGAPGGRLYRTGDLARHLPDGRLVFVGRIDRQVKIRGSRVELGDVESALRKLPGAQDAVVLARADAGGALQLCAWVVKAPSGPAPTAASLREGAAAQLPAYMVPAAFVVLDALPLTPNGKIDHHALPAPDPAGRAERAHVPPRTPTERALAELWAQALRVERVGAEDHFFELGGHSLVAMQLVSKARASLGAALALKDVFERPLLREQAALIDGAGQAAPPGTPAQAAIVPVPRDGRPLRASFGQEELWLLHQLDPESRAYLIPVRLEARGPLEVEALRRAFLEVARRHEVLRTTYATSGGQVVQVVHPAAEAMVRVQVEDVSALPAADQRAAVETWVTQESSQPIDPERGPMVRVVVLRLAPDRHVLHLAFHHIGFDGWSARVMAEELGTLYEAFAAGKPSPLPELPLQYADYAEWERAALTGERLAGELRWWEQTLAGAPEVLALPTDHPRPAFLGGRNARFGFRVPEELSAALKRAAREQGVSLFSVLLAGFAQVLSRYSGEEEVVVGAITANRDQEQLQPLIGYFVRQLPIRLRAGPGMSGRELLAATHASFLAAFEHRQVPFQVLVKALRPERSPAYAPLFQVAIQLDNLPEAPPAPAGSVELREDFGELASATTAYDELGDSAFDLMLAVMDVGGALRIGINYSADLFERPTIERMAGHLQTALRALVESPELPLARQPLLTAGEQRQLLVGWNDTAAELPASSLAHELFEQQAARAPEAIAVVESTGEEPPGQGRRWTFRELDEQSSRLAHWLVERGVGPESRVLVVMEPRLEAIQAFYGVLKAGGAYVPLDAEIPPERLSFILGEARPVAVLTQRHLLGRLEGAGAPVIAVDAMAGELSRYPATSPPRRAEPMNAAYLIYTSGTTGQPKGVVVPHRALVNHNTAIARRLQLSAADRVLQFTPLHYDAAGEEIYPPLLSGSSIVVRGALIPYDQVNPLVAAHGITVMSLPPAYVHEWLTALRSRGERVPPGLRFVLLGGEKIQPESYSLWRSLGGRSVPWINVYGPSEATITAALSQLAAERSEQDPLPIGRPVANVTCYVLDGLGRPVPIGHPGELYLGGAGLARGYLGRPDETAARFLPNPFSSTPGARVYRTGDLARYLPDGQLEVIGRADHQVKVRGHRIELSEIEAALLAQPGIAAAVATARDDLPGGRGVAAYVVVSPEVLVDLGGVRDALKKRLPHYMLPSALVRLERIPLSPNGKVDLAALPRPDASQAGAGGAKVAPRTEVEQRLAAIWAELLGVEEVGATDDFFELGGHSLLAMQMLARVDEELGQEIPIRAVFEDPRIEALARLLAAAPAPADGAASAPARAAADREVVTIRQGAGEGPPVFCFPGFGGNPMVYLDLARALEDRTVYGLLPPDRSASFEAVAAHYLAAIRRVQPRGPYALVGWSVGVHAAYEVARLLAGAGEPPPALLLIDTPTAALSRALEGGGPGTGAGALAEFVRQVAAGVDPSALSEDEQYALLHQRLQEQGEIPPQWTAGDLKRVHQSGLQQAALIEGWTALPYAGRISVVAGDDAEALRDPALGWGALAPGRVDVARVGGIHGNLLDPPQVAAVAGALRACLARAGGAAR